MTAGRLDLKGSAAFMSNNAVERALGVLWPERSWLR